VAAIEVLTSGVCICCSAAGFIQEGCSEVIADVACLELARPCIYIGHVAAVMLCRTG
jgi:hypothetical protein